MTREEVLEKLIHLQKLDDTEQAHIFADNLMCDFLVDLGYEDVAKEYGKVEKWYS